VLRDIKQIPDCGFRIAKLGTRPKGGSPKDNLKARSQETGEKKYSDLDFVFWILNSGF
jgi:hypothetical protein